jgi:hypothetical protein
LPAGYTFAHYHVILGNATCVNTNKNSNKPVTKPHKKPTKMPYNGLIISKNPEKFSQKKTLTMGRLARVGRVGRCVATPASSLA